jgi:hypothetical protein
MNQFCIYKTCLNLDQNEPCKNDTEINNCVEFSITDNLFN